MDSRAKNLQRLTDENIKLRKANRGLFDMSERHTEEMLERFLLGVAIGVVCGFVFAIIFCSLTIGFNF